MENTFGFHAEDEGKGPKFADDFISLSAESGRLFAVGLIRSLVVVVLIFLITEQGLLPVRLRVIEPAPKDPWANLASSFFSHTSLFEPVFLWRRAGSVHLPWPRTASFPRLTDTGRPLSA